MATSPCNSDDTEVSLPTEDSSLTIPAEATPAEAAAIVAAVGAHVRDQRMAAIAAAEKTAETVTWDGKRWQFAGRTAGLSGTARRVPRGAPTDGWTATARLEGL
jgi:hypothetical protein